MQTALMRQVTQNVGNEDEKNNGDSPKLKDSWHLRLDALLSSSLILLMKYSQVLPNWLSIICESYTEFYPDTCGISALFT